MLQKESQPMRTLRTVMLAIALAAGAALATAATAGCAGRAEVRATAPAPRLVWVAPLGVWVVEDYRDPIFFYDGFYWAYVDGFWYRSVYYTRDFVRVTAVPPPIRAIQRPRTYVRYHAPARAPVRAIDRSTHRPIVRDHRSPPTRSDRPTTRDHRRRR
jgi:hypothetical protein